MRHREYIGHRLEPQHQANMSHVRNIYLKAKKAGGMKINFQSPPKNLDEKMVYNILRDYKMLNCEVLVRDDEATVDDLIDVIMKDHRKYISKSFSSNSRERVAVPGLYCSRYPQ